MTHLSGFERAMLALDKHGVPRLNPGGTRNLSLVERIDKLGTGQSVPELMGASEVAAALGITTSNLARQAGLPAPVARLSRGDIYLAEQVRAFAEDRKARRRR